MALSVESVMRFEAVYDRALGEWIDLLAGYSISTSQTPINNIVIVSVYYSSRLANSPILLIPPSHNPATGCWLTLACGANLV